MPKQIGWSNESNLLYTISSQISRLAGIIATSGGGGGGGGTITGGGASGQVTFWDAATNITGNDNLFWNNASTSLLIGTNSIVNAFGHKIRAVGTSDASIGIFRNQASSSASKLEFFRSRGTYAVPTALSANDTIASITGFGWGTSSTNYVSSARIDIVANSIGAIGVEGKINFVTFTNGGGNLGNLSLLNSAPAPGSGATTIVAANNSALITAPKGTLHVRGVGTDNTNNAFYVENSTPSPLFFIDNAGNVTFSSSTGMFWDATNSRLGLHNSSPGAAIDVWNTAGGENAQYRLSDNRVSIPNYSSVGFSPSLQTNTLGFFGPFSVTTGGVAFAGYTSNTNTGTPLGFSAYHGGTSPTTAAIRFLGWKHDGSTNRTALTGNEIVASFQTGATTELLQIRANGNVLIQNGGTFTDDNTNRLQVSGSGKFSLNQNTSTQLTVSNTNVNAAAASEVQVTTNGGTGVFGKYSTLGVPVKIITASNTYLYNGVTAGDIAILNDFATGTIKFATGGVSTAQMVLHQTGNLSLGSSTDDTVNRLQVLGNAKITGETTITSAGSANGILKINSASRTNGLQFNWFDAGNVGEIWYYSETRFRLNSSGLNLTLTGAGNVVLGGNTDTGERLRVNGDVGITGVLRETVTTNRQTASYTLVLADRGKLVETNVGAANTITVPPNSSITFPIGTKIDIAQYGAGQTTIVPGIGVTVRSAGGALKLSAQYSGATIVKIGTDEWYLFGDITV